MPPAPAWPHGDPARVARAILAQPKYRTAPVATGEEPWLVRFLRFLGDAWHRFTGHLGLPVGKVLGMSRWIDVVLIAIAAVVIVVAAVRLALRWSHAAAPRVSRTAIAGYAAASDLRAEAQKCAAAGDYGRAIALLFAAALRSLDEHDLIAFDPARTPGEYRRLLRKTGAASSAPFDDLSGRFVRASFAPGAPSVAEYEAAARALGELDLKVASV